MHGVQEETPVTKQAASGGGYMALEDTVDAFSSPFALHHRFSNSQYGGNAFKQYPNTNVSEFAAVPQKTIQVPVVTTEQDQP